VGRRFESCRGYFRFYLETTWFCSRGADAAGSKFSRATVVGNGRRRALGAQI